MPSPVRPPHKLKLPAHPRFKGFDAFAAREILPRLAEFEADRRRVWRHAKRIAFGTALVVPTLIVLASAFTEIPGIVVFLAFFVLPLIGGGLTAGLPLLRFRSGQHAFLMANTC